MGQQIVIYNKINKIIIDKIKLLWWKLPDWDEEMKRRTNKFDIDFSIISS